MSTPARETRTGGARRPSRRRLLAGAAWTAPVILTAAPAPAYAASCDTVPAMSAANGWTTASSGMTTNGGANGFNGTGYTLLADPAASTAATVTVTSPVRSFCAGRVYTFGFTYNNFGGNSRNLTMTFRVAGNVQALGALNTDTTTPTSGTRSFTFTPVTSVTGSVVLFFQFDAGAATLSGDDITITNFTAT